MAELTSLPPGSGLDLPLQIGSAALAQAGLGACASVMPFKGQLAEVNTRLKSRFSARLADVGRSQEAAVWTCWMGRNQWFLWGVPPTRLAEALAGAAAVTDQSDAWAIMDLTGQDAGHILARLTPIDLDPGVFPPGATARTELAHIMASVTALGQGYRIMVPRSYVGTLVHDIGQAMRSIDAQQALS
ncbi:MAG: sarcosine oxidase subunit gamma [Pseudomonadota bacterium]